MRVSGYAGEGESERASGYEGKGEGKGEVGMRASGCKGKWVCRYR